MRTIKLFVVVFIVIFGQTIGAQNVGIDEPNPSEKLDVNGRIVAKGYKNTILTAEGTNELMMYVPGSFTDVQDLTLTFTLDEATTVISSFSMSLYNQSGTQSIAALRLVIDGSAYSPSLYTFDVNQYLTLNNQHTMELGAGTHTIKVQYSLYGSQPFRNTPNSYQQRKLQVLIFGSN